VKRGGKELLVTQLYIKGHAGNEKDSIWKRLTEKERAAVTTEFAPLQGARAGELATKFDLVVGVTPAA
jgi:protocatechuate 3,4-dioxygenase beta subunit